jgi:NAD(P)-dependent dehydrogenase (short-subunit alcohol dehydrogenase family)
MPAWSLRDKVFLITGGARGIGAATARELNGRGARLALVDLDEAALDATASQLGALGVTADVTDLGAMESVVARVTEELGGIDVVWANAGIASFGPIETTDPDAFTRTVEVNLLGAFRTVRAALPRVRARRGYVAFTASAATFAHAPGMGAYAATKAGVEAMANALRLEIAHEGVEVGTIHPIWIDTDMVREGQEMVSGFQRMLEELPPPLRTIHPVAKAVQNIVRGFERRSRRIFVPEWIRGMHWGRAALHSSLGDRLTGQNAPELLALFEQDAQERGVEGASASERTRTVLGKRERDPDPAA